MFSTLRPQYVFAILLPLAFLPLASRYMLFAIPGLAEVLLSHAHEAITMVLGAHYTATWSGYLLCAFVDGLWFVYRRSDVLAKCALSFALLASLWTSRYYSPINPGFALYRKPTADDWKREHELGALPRSASMGTGGFIIGHLGMHPHATIAMSDQDFLIFDAFSDPGFWQANDLQKVAELIKSGRYRIVLRQSGIVVLAKR